MEIERLKVSHIKKNIIIAIIVIAIISAIVLNFTRAKYRVTDSIEIVNGTVNYTPYDFKMIAMYQEQDGEYVEIESMPSSGYTINEEMSYCTIDNVNHDNEAILYTNANGEHVISGLKKNSKCYLYFDEQINAGDTILSNSKMGSGIPNFNNTSCTSDICGEQTVGLYEETTSKGTTYYFRGDVDDNYLVFADKYWRIIRINEDGSIRIIYNGEKATIDSVGKESVLANGYDDIYTDYTQIGVSAFNSSNNRSEYVGFRYTEGSQRPSNTNNGTDSTIKRVLDTWYSNNLQAYDSMIVSTPGFCNDREVASGYIWSSQPSSIMYYAAYERQRTPTYDCSNANDLYQTKIGLITSDEVIFAGGSGYNNNYYLYTGQAYWTMTPSNSSPLASVFGMVYEGNLSSPVDYFLTNLEYGVRPVINLSPDVTITGSGTITDPYVVL